MLYKSLSWAGLICLAGIVTTPASAQQVTGAIFTTTKDAGTVDANIYADKDSVYLNGGPQKSGAALAPGTYYYQVTDPSGATLLSTDPAVCRQITVGSNGLFSGIVTTGSAAGCSAHMTSASFSGNGAVTVQLSPYNDTPNAGGEYKAWLIAQNDAAPGCNPEPDSADATRAKLIFTNSCAKTDNFKVRQSGSSINITGSKYYDLSTDGIWQNPPEVAIGGWRVDLTLSPGGAVSTYTGQDGKWGITVPAGTAVAACEAMPLGSTYVQTGPLNGGTATNATASSKCWTTTDSTADASHLDFGNVCLGNGGGLTIGFWSNKNGQALVTSADLTFLGSLNLRNLNGSNFDPANYAGFKTWLLNATATNMAYMLSAQLAAMELNVRHGFVNPGALISAPGTNSANPNGFATVGDIMAEANAALGANGVVLSGSPVRPYQEALKNALDAANNNGNFVQSAPCAFTSPY
jgi:hypothetical protein